MKKKKIRTTHSTLNNNIYILKQIHTASPGRIVFNLVVVLLKSISNILLDVYMLRYVINGIQNGLKFVDIVYVILGIAAYHLVVCLLGNYYAEVFTPISDQKIQAHLQKKLFAKASSVDLACFENPEFYDKYVKAISEATSRATSVLSSLSSVVNAIFTISTVSFIIFTIDPLLIIFALLPFAVSLLLGKRFNDIQYEYNMEMQEKSRRKNYVNRIFFLRDYAKDVRLTDINKIMFQQFYASIAELKDTIKKHGFKVGLLDYIFIATNDIVVYLGTILYASYKTIISKTMLFGDCVIVINSINSIAWALRSFVDIVIQLQKHSLYIDNLRYFLEYNPTISKNPNGLVAPSTAEIRFNNVTFQYIGQQSYALKNINLTIHPGEKIALVGHNGAGKSTLVKLIMRLYNPTEGQVLMNNIPIEQYQLDSYRNLFSAAFQDYRMFSLPVLENVLLKDNIQLEERARAVSGMKSAGIYDKIMSLPKQYNTILTKEFDKEGVELSGGEYQKIALARAFTKNSPIIILDEPSSALDPLSEYQMYNSIMDICQNKTVIFISHRLASAVLSDKVYFMENGEIVESGTHSELLKQNGQYAYAWNKQAEKYRGLEMYNEE